MYIVSLLLPLGAALVAGLPQDNQLVDNSPRGQAPRAQAPRFNCPEPFGIFEDPVQCDKYWTCEDGIARASLCDDGLVFDLFKGNAGIPDPCESPYVVDCDLRTELQEPSFSSDVCPRKNGIFADPDPAVCNRFYTCIKGHATSTDCAVGLHFDETNGNCAWAASSGRTGCGKNVKNCIGEFCCTGEEQLTGDGVSNPHPTFPNLVNCQKFYVCLNKETPQESSCNLGQVYNEASLLCDFPENVPECESWYADNPPADGTLNLALRRDFNRPAIN